MKTAPRSAALLTSAGRPFPGITVELLDAAMQPVLEGEIGEICVRGPLLMSGYLHQEAATADGGSADFDRLVACGER
jgi:acyl-CoA synthetase (AMP-forming)/AMP-acid ligase II